MDEAIDETVARTLSELGWSSAGYMETRTIVGGSRRLGATTTMPQEAYPFDTSIDVDR